MAEKPQTKARKVADDMESERMAPATTSVTKYLNTDDDGPLRGVKAAGRGVIGVPMIIGAGAADLATRPFKKGRSEEEMNELSREVSKGAGKGGGYKKGGKVSSASKRADGIAQRGKTKGRMV